ETEDDQEAISALSRRVGGRVGTGNRVEKASQSSMQTFPQLCDRGDERGLLTMNSSTHAEEVAHFGQLKSKAARRPSRNCAQGHRAAHARARARTSSFPGRVRERHSNSERN